jgi:hypothetical protein
MDSKLKLPIRAYQESAVQSSACKDWCAANLAAGAVTERTDGELFVQFDSRDDMVRFQRHWLSTIGNWPHQG